MGEEALELALLDVLATGPDTVAEAAAALDVPADQVDQAMRWAMREGLVLHVPLQKGDHFELTPQGQFVVGVRQATGGSVDQNGQVDFADVARNLAEAWAAAQQGKQDQHAKATAGWVIGDKEREAAVQALSTAYAAGRLDLPALERRTQRALTAQTRGELAEALALLPERQDGTQPLGSPWPQWLLQAFKLGVLAVGLILLGVVFLIVLVAALR